MAVRSLSGFQRVTLRPGEAKPVTVHVPKRQGCYWSVEKGGWTVAGGSRAVFVGSSSRDIRLNGSVQIAGDGELEDAPKPGVLALADSETGRLPH